MVFVDKIPGNKPMWRVKIKENDLMMFKVGTTKQQHIDMILNTKIPLKLGKFLIPEFNEYIGFDISELGQFKDITKHLDDLHKYQKVIYDAYIENGSFSLTNEQLEKAYIEYKKYRK
jgi:translation initiation factor IF-1